MTSFDHDFAVPRFAPRRRPRLKLIRPVGACDPPFTASIAVAERCVTVAGELDLASAHVLAESVTMLAQVGQAQTIVVDLSAVRFMDVCALNALEERRRQQAEVGVLVALVGTPRIVTELYALSGLPLERD